MKFCESTIREKTVKDLLYGIGFAVLAAICHLAAGSLTFAEGTTTRSDARYFLYMTIFTIVFVIAAAWQAVLVLRSLLVRGSSDVAKSVRSQLTPEEQTLPLKEQFALVDNDLSRNGLALAGGQLLIGEEWIFAKSASQSAMRLANIAGVYPQLGKSGVFLCVRDKNGNQMTISKLAPTEIDRIQAELQARMSQLTV